MSAYRPKHSINLPLGHLSRGTRKLLSRLLGECHGAGIHKTLPAKSQLCLAEKCLVPPPHPKFEKQEEHGIHLNLHPPSPITHFPYQLLSFFTQAPLIKRIHPTNAPPVRSEVSRGQKVFMQSPTVGCSYAFPWISHQEFFRKPSTCSIRSMPILRRMKFAWDNAIHFYRTRPYLHPFGCCRYHSRHNV